MRREEIEELEREGEEGEEVVIAVSSMGMKVTRRGGWMREKREGWLKGDVETKEVIHLEVKDERVHEKN